MNGPGPATIPGDQIGRFVSALFRYAAEGSFISLRAFDQVDRGKPPLFIEAVRINGDLQAVAAAATRAAGRSDKASPATVFAPPVATFDNPRTACGEDVDCGVALSVEIDQGDPGPAIARLEGLLGPVTILIRSGGEWTDTSTGEVHPKVHAHWRLSEPTRTAADHARLQYARRMAALLVGGDPTAASLAHPLRWPGSMHRKASPRMADIERENPDKEIHLPDAIEALEGAVEAAGLDALPNGPRVAGQAQAPVADIASALSVLSNPDLHWEQWNRIGMATWAATGGAVEGLDAWEAWSAKSGKHVPGACDARWTHYGKSPPTRIGAGTIMLMAKAEGWIRPDREPRRDQHLSDPGYWASHAAEPQAEPQPDAAKPPPVAKSKLTIINPRDLLGVHVPPREWIVEDWLPVGVVTVNFGDGGTGKTLLTQQLMTSCATRKPWCGLAVTPCRSLALFCEDDEHELHRRQDRINDALGVTFDDLDDMRWISGVGQDNVLGAVGPDGRVRLTEKFEAIRAAAKEHQARLVSLDTAADIFAGNENDKIQVRQFLNLMGGLALEINGVVLINAHPSRAGMSSGREDGASTAWSNTARSRWSLSHPATDGDAQPDTNERILTRQKANYARKGETITLRWAGGVLMPVNQQGGIAGTIARKKAEQVFLSLLDRSAERGVLVSHNTRAGNYAPKVFSQHPDRDGYKRADFEAAMGNLLASRQIRVGRGVNASRHTLDCIVRQGPEAQS